MKYEYYENNKPKKYHMVTVKLSDDEYNKLNDIADHKLLTLKDKNTAIFFHSKSDVLRFVIDNYKGSSSSYWSTNKTKNIDDEIERQTKLIATRKYYTYQLQQIGKNINQIAKRANEGVYDPALVAEFRKKVKQLDRKIKKTGVFNDDL